MSSEILAIPEEHLQELIDIIRVGLEHTKYISTETRRQLIRWCDSEEAYLEYLLK